MSTSFASPAFITSATLSFVYLCADPFAVSMHSVATFILSFPSSM